MTFNLRKHETVPQVMFLRKKLKKSKTYIAKTVNMAEKVKKIDCFLGRSTL